MTDAQLLTLAIAIVVPLSLLIYSNSRITDAKETLRAEIGLLRAEMEMLRSEMRAEMRDLRAELVNELRAMHDALRIHELEHHK